MKVDRWDAARDGPPTEAALRPHSAEVVGDRAVESLDAIKVG